MGNKKQELRPQDSWIHSSVVGFVLVLSFHKAGQISSGSFQGSRYRLESHWLASVSPMTCSRSESHLRERSSRVAMFPRWHITAVRCPSSTSALGRFRLFTQSRKLR